MIVMFVSDEDGREVRWIETEPCKPLRRFPKIETTVDQDTGVSALDDETVALAAAAERCESHHAGANSRAPSATRLRACACCSSGSIRSTPLPFCRSQTPLTHVSRLPIELSRQSLQLIVEQRQYSVRRCRFFLGAVL